MPARAQDRVKLDMQSLAFVDVSSATSGRGAWVDAELRLRQREVFAHKARISYPSPLPSTSIGDGVGTADTLTYALLREYTDRNVTTALQNVYTAWTPGAGGSGAARRAPLPLPPLAARAPDRTLGTRSCVRACIHVRNAWCVNPRGRTRSWLSRSAVVHPPEAYSLALT